MSSNERQPKKYAQISQEIKDLKYKCAETYDMLKNNIPNEVRDITLQNHEEKTLCYVDGVRAVLEASETPIPTDDDALTSQFLSEITEKTSQVEDLIAYQRGVILDIEDEIASYKSQIKLAEEAKKKPQPQKDEVKPEHLQEAKERFQQMRKALRELIYALFPDEAETVMDMLAHFMQLKSMEGSSGYAEVTTEIFPVVESLKDMGLLTVNPYNNKEVKLAF